jgi:hypothetical protein
VEQEPSEPFLTGVELAIICGLAIIAAFCGVWWWCERQTADLREWFEDATKGW